MKKILSLIIILISIVSYGQTIKPSNHLIIEHKDIKLYLDDDTSTMISKLTLKYTDFKKLKSNARCDCWFIDKYSKLKKSNYDKAYNKSGYDLGHLTPSHITTYDTSMNRFSFSLFNQAPQFSYFNEHPWEQLEEAVESKIDSLKQDATIITGVIYNNNKKQYLKGGKIKIPIYYYKIVIIGNKNWIWLGQNIDDKTACIPKEITLKDLNNLFTLNGMNVRIK